MLNKMKKIRVCHLSSAHGQEDTRIFHKECVSLAKAGYDVYEITRGKTYDKNGVYIVGVSKEKVSRKERMLKTTKEVYKKAMELDADIYHAHDPELLPVCKKLKMRGKIVVFDSHENVAGTIREKLYIPKMIRNAVSRLYEAYQKSICTRLDAVITATPNITEYFIRIGCKTVIDLCNFPILKDYTRPDYTSRKIVFAGNMERQWNHDRVISAISGINDIEYVFCSAPDEDKLADLKQLSGWEKVSFRGKVPFETVPEILAESAVGLSILSPGNNTDGINGNMANTKIFEEMMAGLPVICTKFKRWAEFVEGYDCGICVNPHKTVEIKNAIEKLINSPEECERMGNNGRKAVEEKFNWGIEEKKLLKLYKKLEERIK